MAVRTTRLQTPFERDIPDVPFAEYPRPQMERASYLNLNGTWELSVRRGKTIRRIGKITVPFVPESSLSGIEKTFQKRDMLIYCRTFTLPDGFVKDRVLLHFGAVDQTAWVFVNDVPVGEHTGGYLPFSCDITDALTDGANTLRVEVSDPLDTALPYGKQRRKRGGMWYTPISGIWQTVWCESIPAAYIKDLRITPTLDSVTIETDGGEEEKHLIVHFDSGDKEYTYRGDCFTLGVEDAHLWTPETPYLYRFTLQTGEDIVRSYFALRTVSVGRVGACERLLLNGKPYFFNGLLDQGYFSDGIYLPATEEGYRCDILTMKALGFNTLRKHIKIEPAVFYYECDRLGMVVFQDIVNSGAYSFLRDTALPTIGFKHKLPRLTSKRRRKHFLESAEQTVAHLYDHPCVCYYTLFNEGWGQHDADALYTHFKTLDGSRIWDATSGWFFGEKSDVQSEHVYFKPVKLKAGNKPLVLSEFGGYSCKIAGHAFNLDKTYGYRFYESTDEFCTALYALYRDEIVPAAASGLCAAILTQVSDVEDETNGLVTYDRQVCKVDAAEMARVNDEVQAAFAKSLHEGVAITPKL